MFAYVMAATMLTQSSPQQFDLICTGTASAVVSSNPSQPQSQPFNLRFQLDLTRSVWCRVDCEKSGEIARFSPTAIDLRYLDDELGESTIRINRTSGRLSWETSDDIAVYTFAGTCQSAPYTPIPPARF
jgi:hypothetical protein